jgi:hypothetical protein
MNVDYLFVNHGETLAPKKDTIILDVGMDMTPGVIDHHHPQAEAECTASLIVKYPGLVLDHLRKGGRAAPESLTVITHRLPDFDAVSSIFLVLKLLETGQVDGPMAQIAGYARMADSASFPKSIDLAATPFAILRALFSDIHLPAEEANRARVEEGLRLMKFLYAKSGEGQGIVENRLLYAGIDRYQKAMRRIEDDYFRYLADLERGFQLRIWLPLLAGNDRRELDGLVAANPRSFLFKEWARRDKTHSPLGRGFSFIMSSFGPERFILGVDTEEGVNLKGLAPRLDEREEAKRKMIGRSPSPGWYDGNCAFFEQRIVVSPRDGTALALEEILGVLLDYGRPSDKLDSG